jgi:hypothetical protein
LEQSSTSAAQFIRGLSVDQLQKTGNFPLLVLWYGVPPRVEQLVEALLAGHPSMHISDITAVCSQ